MIPEDEKYEVYMNMTTYGGSFVKALGEALMHADPINTQKIKDTWPVYWRHYRDFKKERPFSRSMGKTESMVLPKSSYDQFEGKEEAEKDREDKG